MLPTAPPNTELGAAPRQLRWWRNEWLRQVLSSSVSRVRGRLQARESAGQYASIHRSLSEFSYI
jgi:hypothetical protein